MKLLTELQKQVSRMGTLRHAWFTSFNADIEFIETYVLPVTIGANVPRNGLEYEQLQQALIDADIDFRVFCDPRFLETSRVKRTCIPVHGVRPARTANVFSDTSLFHAKVIYLEDNEGKRVIGTGSANLTVSGWGRNLEAFTFLDINTFKNYREIRKFFTQLCLAADIECTLKERPRFEEKTDNWHFVHSYQDQSFAEQLLADADGSDLVVWSPYLPRDLVGFIGNLKAAAGIEDLEIHLVPDRLKGQYLRTEWNEDLGRMLATGRLTVYENPAPRHPNTELCHAKLWKLQGRLAIGSWNFTGPGSNCMRDADGTRGLDNNVEAGFIIEDRHDMWEACGRKLSPGANDFASPAQLDEESLEVKPLPPFDLHVTFDWLGQGYSFEGKWLGNGQRGGFSVRLPGVTERVPLEWNSDHQPQQPGELEVDDRALLRDRICIVYRGDQEIHKELLKEKHVHSRRAQAFESLQDLLEAFVQDEDTKALPDLPLRAPVEEDPPAPPDNPPADLDAPPDADPRNQGDISYFRLFHAMHVYRQKLSGLHTLKELDSHVFALPGCLLELVDKMREQIGYPGREVFNWFLANEVRSLCEFAQALRRRLIRGLSEREGDYTPVPVSRWRKLSTELPLPPPPAGVHKDYLNLLREQCEYE
ncbi:phospholipase D family protein [Pseudoduganella sp. GCM10020061]|uniref:phospholipase D family protein n=1 Tax=Pseudoduganella sp. GCM10020061 TaxID=3317345 RepID=UPI00363E314C